MPQQKSWVEVFLMPVVIAIVGTAGTYFITSQQEKNALQAREAQLQSARELAEADREIKIIEMFSEKITSPEESERIMALRLLRAIDGELAGKLAEAVQGAEPTTSEVRRVAQEVKVYSAARGYSFPVVKSTKLLEDARTFAEKLKQRELKYPPEVYLSDNGFYAVCLGGYLSQTEALQRVEYAKRSGIATDAYIRTSRSWGENLLAKESQEP